MYVVHSTHTTILVHAKNVLSVILQYRLQAFYEFCNLYVIFVVLSLLP